MILISSARYTPRRYKTSLSRWFNAADPSNNGIIPADSAALSLYADKSVNASNIIQSTGANQPVYKKNILNGHPMILFNGTSNFFSGTVVGGTQYSVTLICKSTSTAVNVPVYNGDSSFSGYGYFYDTNRNVLHGGVAVKTDAANPQAFEIITIAWDGSASTLRINGVNQTIGNVSSGFNAPTLNLFVGSSTGTQEFFSGYLGDIIMRNAYSLSAIQADEHYLSTINGLAI